MTLLIPQKRTYSSLIFDDNDDDDDDNNNDNNDDDNTSIRKRQKLTHHINKTTITTTTTTTEQPPLPSLASSRQKQQEFNACSSLPPYEWLIWNNQFLVHDDTIQQQLEASSSSSEEEELPPSQQTSTSDTSTSTSLLYHPYPYRYPSQFNNELMSCFSHEKQQQHNNHRTSNCTKTTIKPLLDVLCTDIWRIVIEYIDFQTCINLGQTSKIMSEMCYDTNLWRSRIIGDDQMRQRRRGISSDSGSDCNDGGGGGGGGGGPWKLKCLETVNILADFDAKFNLSDNNERRFAGITRESVVTSIYCNNNNNNKYNLRKMLVNLMRNYHFVNQRASMGNGYEAILQVDLLFGLLKLAGHLSLPLLTASMVFTSLFPESQISIMLWILWLLSTLALLSSMIVPERMVTLFGRYGFMERWNVNLCITDLTDWSLKSCLVRWQLINCERRVKEIVAVWCRETVPYCIFALFCMKPLLDESISSFSLVMSLQALIYCYPIIVLHLDRSNYRLSAYIGKRKFAYYSIIPLPLIGYLMDVATRKVNNGDSCPWFIYLVLQLSGILYLVQGGSYVMNRLLAYIQAIQVNILFNYGSWDSIVFILVTLLPHDEIKAWELFIAVVFIQGLCNVVPHMFINTLKYLTSSIRLLNLLRHAFDQHSGWITFIHVCWSLRHVITLFLTTTAIVCYVVLLGERRVERRKGRRKMLMMYHRSMTSANNKPISSPFPWDVNSIKNVPAS